MFQILLLIGGLVLLLVSPPLFAGAATVGWILLAVFVFITLWQIAVLIFASRQVSKVRRGFDPWDRFGF